MATDNEAEEAILARIVQLAPNVQSQGLLNLAEALAWLRNPSQPHGGHSEVQVKS